jgi:hypothetical protein
MIRWFALNTSSLSLSHNWQPRLHASMQTNGLKAKTAPSHPSACQEQVTCNQWTLSKRRNQPSDWLTWSSYVQNLPPRGDADSLRLLGFYPISTVCILQEWCNIYPMSVTHWKSHTFFFGLFHNNSWTPSVQLTVEDTEVSRISGQLFTHGHFYSQQTSALIFHLNVLQNMHG